MTSPTTPQAGPGASAPPVKETARPHPLTPLIRGWVVLLLIIFGFGRQLVPDGSGDSSARQLLRLGIGWLALIVTGVVLLAAAAGFMTWYFTRFIIDDEELRVETGWLAKRSRRIAFERIQSVDIVQPLAARIFGLVELRIEAGAGDSRTTLRYLSRRQGTQIRDYLMARAHGDRVTMAGTSALPQASAFTDLSASERTLVTIPPGRLVAGLVLSTEFLSTILVLIIVLGIGIATGRPFVGLAGFVPMIFAAISLVSRRVTAQFNYTLAESARGLRITRGLTNLTSQSLPINRIQGVRISQPILWRPFGWSRVDIDVLGYGSSSERDENNTDVSSILLPIAVDDQVRAALTRVLPDAGLDSLELHPSPRRARLIRWFDGWTLRYGWNAAVIVSRHGFLDRTTDVVPHAKVQSVRITRGPLQRRLRLASVHVDTPRGPVSLVAHHIDPVDARELALSELDRARAARRAALTGSGSAEDDQILHRFGVAGVSPLGSGGESIVYPLGSDQVLRVYKGDHDSATRLIQQLRPAYQTFGQYDLGFRTPLIIESGELHGRVYTVDQRIPGRSLAAWLPTATQDQRRSALLQYVQVASVIKQLPLPAAGFGRLFGADPRRFESLSDLLEDQLRTAVRQTREQIDRDLPADAVEQVITEVTQRQCEPRLVHGDYFPGNVFVDVVDGAPFITGVGDFSPHTLAADPLMDIAGAISLMGMAEYPGAEVDQAYVGEQAVRLFGQQEPRIEYWLDVYRRYYAIYYAPDPAVYPYSMAELQR
jgi:putative membrane protein